MASPPPAGRAHHTSTHSQGGAVFHGDLQAARDINISMNLMYLIDIALADAAILS